MKIEGFKKKAKALGYSSFEGVPMFKGEIIPKGKLAFDFSYNVLTTCFDRLVDIEKTPGLYQIFTLDGLPLKVGIAKNLRSRLNQHLKSSQKRLKSTIDGEAVSGNDINTILKNSTDLNERLKAWEASKEVGVGLKAGLTNLVGLRNKTVQALNYKDYFSYQVSDYGMSRAEMLALCEQLVVDIWPLYRELHTYARPKDWWTKPALSHRQSQSCS